MLNRIGEWLWYKLVHFAGGKKMYPLLYRSYWHSKFIDSRAKSEHVNYFSATPNRGAGIGHQLANWIAGYWFSKQFGLRFAHIPFSSSKWESVLGLGENEMTVTGLLTDGNYKKIHLPLFDESNPREVMMITSIIRSYQSQKIVFCAEQDQYYRAQIGVMSTLKHKFYSAKARQFDKVFYSADYFNIAVHVRRGDITLDQNQGNRNMAMRVQANDYYEKVLDQTIERLITAKPIAIYLFSQGTQNDFTSFEKYSNIHFCLDMNAYESFLHMVFADLLITSKSSFSYKPALISNGIKICPKDFWHDYPSEKSWILVKDNGVFDMEVVSI